MDPAACARPPFDGPSLLDVNIFMIKELESYTLHHCPIYQSSLWIRLLVFAHFLSLYISVGYYIISPLRRELYVFFVGTAMIVDELIGYATVYILQEQAPYAFVGCSPRAYNAPDPYVQSCVLVFVLILSYHAIHGTPLGFVNRAFMTAMLSLLCMAEVRLGYSSPRHIVLGAVIGTAEALLFQILMFYVLSRYAGYIVTMRIAKFLGYEDTTFAIARTDRETTPLREKDDGSYEAGGAPYNRDASGSYYPLVRRAPRPPGSPLLSRQ